MSRELCKRNPKLMLGKFIVLLEQALKYFLPTYSLDLSGSLLVLYSSVGGFSLLILF